MVSRRKLRNKKSHSRKSGGKRVVRVHKRTHKHGRKYSGGFKWPWKKQQKQPQEMELHTVLSPVNYAITRKPLVDGDIESGPANRTEFGTQFGGSDDSVNILIKKGINQYDQKNVSVSRFIDAATELVKRVIGEEPKLEESLKAVVEILDSISGLSGLDERNEREAELFKLLSVRLQVIITKIIIPKYLKVRGDQTTDSFKYLSGVYEGGALSYI